MQWLRTTQEGIALRIQLTPRSKRTGVLGEHNGRLKLGVHAPAVDGAANEALVALLAELLHCPKRAIAIIHGTTSRQKEVTVAGVSVSVARSKLSDVS